MIKSGFIAIIGRPNAGKSTLINKIVGERCPLYLSDRRLRKQNSRNYQQRGFAGVFIDTPGIHRAKDKLSNIC